MIREKGVDVALAAARELDVELRIAGPLTDAAFSDNVLRDPHVTYLGSLSYVALFDEYRSPRALTYMTRYVEAFGLSVIESLAAGTPVITTGLGGTGELIEHGVTGYIASGVTEVCEAYGRCATLSPVDCMNSAREYSVERMVSAIIAFARSAQPTVAQRLLRMLA